MVELKKNIAQFIGTIQDGGAETLVKDYALMLDKKKINNIIIVYRRNPNSANEKKMVEQGVKIIPIYKSSLTMVTALQKFNYWWLTPYRLKRILKNENIDVLHIHMALLNKVAKISKSIRNIKLFYTCHSIPERYLSPSKMKKEYRAAKKLIQNNNLRIISLHDDMKKEIDALFNIKNTVVIKNGIDFKRFLSVKDDKLTIRSDIGIPFDSFVLGHVGRFNAIKNHQFLISIFKEAYKKNPNAFLLMIGDGNLKSQIETELCKYGLNDHFLILSHRADIPRLLKAMDVFVFPSLAEGLGIALIEAQVSGLKCVASDTIPQEAFKTESAIPMSLKKAPSEWCNAIFDNSVKHTPHGNIADYDMNNEIKKLEMLYLGEYDD